MQHLTKDLLILVPVIRNEKKFETLCIAGVP